MGSRSDTLQALLLTGGSALAGSLIPVFPILALPLAAAGLARLWVSGHKSMALAAIVLAAGVTATADPSAAILIASTMLAAGPLAARALEERSALTVAAVLTVVVFAATVGAQALAAYAAGGTLGGDVARAATETVRLLAGSLGETDASRLAELRRLLVVTWPATYLQIAAVAALAATAAAGLGAGRGGVQVRRFPALARLDLVVHVLWLPVVAVAGLAIGRMAGLGAVETVALNALLVSRVPLALQGLGVFAATYERLGMGKGARGLGYALAVFVELTTYAISLVGLIDFWANFRRLPRDGAQQGPRPLEEPRSSG